MWEGMSLLRQPGCILEWDNWHNGAGISKTLTKILGDPLEPEVQFNHWYRKNRKYESGLFHIALTTKFPNLTADTIVLKKKMFKKKAKKWYMYHFYFMKLLWPGEATLFHSLRSILWSDRGLFHKFHSREK